MPLAAILGLCLLLAPPPAGNAVIDVSVRLQTSEPQHDSPPAESPQEPSKSSEPETKSGQPPAQPQTPSPDSAQPPASSAADATAQKPGSNPTPSAGAKAKKRSRKRVRKHKPAVPPSAGPTKVIVRNGSTPDPTAQLSPSLTQGQASHQRQNTTRLLAATDANLTKISSRQLSSTQQDMVNQIRKYMEQAKAADATGDLQRAHNLALKAQQLSNELVKH
jgi:hypothetical protein